MPLISLIFIFYIGEIVKLQDLFFPVVFCHYSINECKARLQVFFCIRNGNLEQFNF